jgi:hypothetical protein
MNMTKKLGEVLKDKGYLLERWYVKDLDKGEEEIDLLNFFNFILITDIINTAFNVNLKNEDFFQFEKTSGTTKNLVRLIKNKKGAKIAPVIEEALFFAASAEEKVPLFDD